MATIPGYMDPEVYRHAACGSTEDPGFFPIERDAWHEAARTIRRYCQGCPVLNRCHRQAQENHEFGVWGGRYRTSQADGRPRQYTLVELTAGPRAAAAS